VADIVSACEMIGLKSGRKILLYIKHKRRPSAAHDDDYFDHVASLCASGKLQEIRNDSNLYSIIGASTMVIVLPYSSPAYVADFLGVPAIYYDPTGKLLFNQERASWIHFVSGRDDLALRIRRLIEETKSSEPLGCPVK
jgi:polysaccharide biosynthesis PFTS motif protein